MAETIERAHTIILKAGGDTARDLARELYSLADKIERGDITVGCIGGPVCGSTYSYKVTPMTHDEYFRKINERLQSEEPSG